MNSFEIKALSAGYGKHTVLHDIDLTVAPEKNSAILLHETSTDPVFRE